MGTTVDTAPTAFNDSYDVNEDAVLKVSVGSSVLANDTDPDHGDKLSAILVNSTSNLLFSFQSNGTFIFDARNYDYLSAGETITDTFTYEAFDGQKLSNIATVTITIHGVNDPPVAQDDSATLSAGTATDINVLSNDHDIDELDTLTIVALADVNDGNGGNGTSDSNPADGLSITTDAGGTVSLVSGHLHYVAAANFFGVDTFTYTISDGHGGSATATVSVTVNPVNGVLVAVNDSYSTDENTPLSVGAALGVLSNDSDSDGDTLAAQLVSGPAKGIVKFNSDGSFTFDPNGQFAALAVGQHEDVTFTYQATDGSSLSNTATVTVTVNGANSAPVLSDTTDPAAVLELLNASAQNIAAITGTFSVTDLDVGDTETPSIVGSPVVKLNGAAFALPAGASALTAAGALTLTGATSNGGAVNIGYSYDPAAAALDFLNAGDSLTITYTVKVNDGTVDSNTQDVTFTITGTNDPPVAVADTASATEAGGVANGTPGINPTGNVLTNDTDLDRSDTKTVQGVAAGSPSGPLSGSVGSSVGGTYGSLTIGSDGSYTYTVNNSNTTVQGLRTASDTLTDTFSYTVKDSSSATSTTTLTVTIHGANDAPTAVADTASATEAGGVNNGTPGVNPTGNVVTNDTDPDSGDTKTVQGVATGVASGPLSSNVGSPLTGTYGSLTVAADGSYTYTVDNSNTTVQALRLTTDTLTDTFSYTMKDAASAASTTTLTLTIHGANDAPVAMADTDSATEAGGVANGTPGVNPTGNVLTNDTDVDSGDTKTVAGVAAGTPSGPLSSNVGSTVTGSYGSLVLMAGGGYTYTVDNSNTTVQGLLTAANTLTDTFTYTMKDTAGATSTTTLTVTIHGANDAPTAVADTASATEAGGVNNGTPGVNPTGNVLTNDTDPDSGDTKTVSAVNGAAANVGAAIAGTYGSLTLASDGSYTYTVDNSNATVQALQTASDTLTDNFTYAMKDAAGATSSTTLAVTIHGADDAPVANNDTNSALSNHADPDATGNVLQNVDHTNVEGVFADHADTDIDSPSASLTVTAIRTGGVEGSGTAGTVGTPLTGAHGTLTINANGSYTYNVNDGDAAVSQLAAGQSIDDVFNYTVSDGQGQSDIATLDISIFASYVAPTLADRLFINEIDVAGGGTAHSSAIEIINNYNNALGTSDLAQGKVQIRGPGGSLATVDLGKLVGLTEDASGNPLSGSALPGNSVLVLFEPSTDHPNGLWEVFGGSTVKSGTFAADNQAQWDLGTTVADPVGVNLAQGGSSIDLFVANGVSVAGFTGVGTLGNGNHDLGSTAKSGFTAPPGRAGAAWWGGAELPADQSAMPADVKALIALYNNEYNGSLSGPSDDVFARVYDRYLVSNKGSSVDTQFIDENDSGDWAQNSIGTLGVKNNSTTVANSQDATDNVNPAQGTGVHGTSTPSVANADGQNVLWIGNAGGTLNGGAGADFLYGGTGADSILGGTGNDFLYGSSGNDNLNGGSGADKLNGGLGNDVLTGGSGPDQFIFSTALGAGNVDTIADFSHAQGDKIVLDHAIFSGFSSSPPGGALSAADFAAHIVYSAGALSYDPDGPGGVAAVQFATLTGSPAVVAGDFLVV